METRTFNARLLTDLVLWAAADQKALDKVFEGWGDWNQHLWAKELRNGVCKTSYCLAGQAVVQGGYGLLYTEMDSWRDADGKTWREFSADLCAPMIEQTDEHGKPVRDSKGKRIMVPDHTRSVYISTAAQRILGIYETEADRLFNGDNNLADVVRIAIDIAASRDVTLDLPEHIRDLAREPVAYVNE